MGGKRNDRFTHAQPDRPPTTTDRRIGTEGGTWRNGEVCPGVLPSGADYGFDSSGRSGPAARGPSNSDSGKTSQ